MKQSELTVNDLNITVKRIARRRQLLLTVEADGICVKAPYYSSNREISRFVSLHQEWISQQQQKLVPLPTFKDGDCFYFLGDTKQLCLIKGKAETTVTDSQLRVSFPSHQADVIQLRVKQFFLSRAKHYLTQRLEHLAQVTKQFPTAITIKPYKARWGCCGRHGDIAINWKLIMAPPEAIDYVLIHELCHLTHFNHSKQFWQLVGTFCPNYRQHKRWLSEHAHVLSIPF